MSRVLLVLAALFFVAPSSASAWCQMTTSDAAPTPTMPCVLADPPSSFPLAWRHRCTSISLSSALGVESATDGAITEAALRGVLARSIGSWTNVDCGGATTGLSVEILAEENLCTRPVHYRSGRNVHSITFVDRGWSTERSHDVRALAVTYVWHDPTTGEILDADLELNEETKDFHVCALPGCTDVVPLDSAVADLENTITHEMGHYFGLAHTADDPLATMFAEANPGETLKRDLSADDETGVCAIYPPGTLPAACDPTPAGGLGLDCAAPSSCGCRAPGVGTTRSGVGLVFLALALALVLRRR